MTKRLQSLTIVAAFGSALAGCSGGSTTLTPIQPRQPGNGTGAVQYVQIERLSRPAIKEVFEPFQDHQKSNAVEPYQDSTIQADIKGTEDALRPPTTYQGKASDYGATLAGLLYPDEYSVNLNGNAPQNGDADPFFFLSNELTPARFGGRAPNDDVIYLELGSLFGGILPAATNGAIPEDNQENTCLSGQNIAGPMKPGGQNAAKLTTNTFPYLNNPA